MTIMAFLGIYGPHASGKTTAMSRLLDRLSRTPDRPVTVICADNDIERYWHGSKLREIKYKGRDMWKGKAEDKRALCRDCIADDERLYVVESVRFDTHLGIAKAYLECKGGAHVLFLVASWDTFRQFMVDRNKRNGTEFNNAYWTRSKLAYEGYARYVNQAAKYLKPAGVPYEVIQVSYDRHEWPDIDSRIIELVAKPVEEWYA